MDYFDEVSNEVSELTADINPDVVELIRLHERIKIFTKLRNLIAEKDYLNDEIASAILGWAYERMSED